MGKKSYRSIRVKLLTWFMGISIVSLSVLGGIVYVNIRGILDNRIRNELNISARGIEGKVSAFIEGKKGRTLDFCSDGIVKDGLTYYDPDDPGVDALIKSTNHHIAKNKLSLDSSLEDILILNLKGRVVFATNEKNSGKDKSRKDYFLAIAKYFKDKEFLKKLQQNPTLIVFATDFYLSDDLKTPTLAISNIITARATGLPLGVLVNRYKGDMLNSLLTEEGSAIGRSGKAYIVNKDGLLLTLPNFIKEKKDKYEIILREQVKTEPITRAQSQGKETLGIYRDSLGNSVLGASVINKEKGWLIIAEKDTVEAFAPLRFLALIIVSIAFICITIVILLSFLISGKITDPILKITQAAGKVAQGDFEAEINYASNDELGILVKDFNQMVQDLKKLHSQLLQCDRLASLGTLSAGVAHEIKNPLAIIIQGLAFLRASMPEGDAIAIDAVERIEKAGMRAANIVRDLLSFSRQNPPALEAQNIAAVIEDTLPLVEHQIKLKNIKILRRVSADLPFVKVDNSQMKQAFINIILNAVEAMPRGGTITIAVEKPKTQAESSNLEIRFTDSGCGITEENLHKVFDPFFSTKQKQGGTGLGLSVTKGIIEGHNGTVEIESKLGEGTTVIVRLPIAD